MAEHTGVVVVYERVSTAQQDLARQAFQRDRARAEYPDREIVVIPDDGVSAFRVPIKERHGGRQLWEMIEAGRVAAVFTDEQTRLHRGKLPEWFDFKTLCDDHGTRIVINGRELRADDETDELMSVFDAVRARRESLDKAHRARGAARVRAQRGRHHGGRAPYGYRRANGTLVIDPVEARVIQRMAREFIEGTSQKEIARRLNADHIPTKEGRGWVQPVIQRMLANPVYVGKVRLKGEIVGDADHPPILDADTWALIQSTREAFARTKSGARSRPSAGSHLFIRGMLKCGRCGGSMVPRTGRYARYLCATRIADRNACDQPNVPRRDVDEGVFDYFETIGLDVAATKEQIAAQLDARATDTRAQRDAAERELRLAEDRYDRVRRHFQDGKLDPDDWADQRAQLAGERDAARAEVARLSRRESEIASDPLVDADDVLIDHLTAIRAAVVGDVRNAAGLDAVRAALLRLFEGFTLVDRGADNPFGRYLVQPHVRADALDFRAKGTDRAVMKTPLFAGADKANVGFTT